MFYKQMNLFSRLPDVLDNTCENKMPSKCSYWTPITNIKLCDNQEASTSSGDASNQGETCTVTFKQHRFEPHGSTYTQIFFSIFFSLLCWKNTVYNTSDIQNMLAICYW